MAQIDFGLLNRDAPQQAGASFDQGRRNALAMQLAQQQQEQNALGMGKMRQDDENRNALRNISMQSGGDPQKIIQGLYQQGMPTEAMAMQGHASQQQNSDVARAMALVKLMGESSYQIYQNPDPSLAAQKLMEYGRISGGDVSAEIQKVQMMSPDQLRQWAKGHMTSAQEHEQKFKTFQHGNTIFSAVSDPVTGELKQGGSIVIPESESDKRKADMEQKRIDYLTAQENRLVNPPPEKPQAGYRWTAEGNQEPIPGGPADAKAQAKRDLQIAGSSDLDISLAALRDAYNRLEKGGGITSTDEGALSNIGAAISSSSIGQGIGKALGTDNQSARNDIVMTRPALLAALMKSTGMSAKQMDSNAELKLWLATATDPNLDVGANRRALNNIETKYIKRGGGDMKPPPPGDTQKYSAEDLQHTADKHGITVDEVKRRLGVK